ncbi:MAG: AAA family ATPase [Gammaproteobacteria bacterium]
MANADFYPRYVAPRLTGALADTPVVLIHGPRQSGKTTLARAVGDASGYAYISFDDDVLRAAAQADPVGFVADLPNKVVLDEVQRVPELFTSLKVAVDRDRRAGALHAHRFGQCVAGAEVGGLAGRENGDTAALSVGPGGTGEDRARFS